MQMNTLRNTQMLSSGWQKETDQGESISAQAMMKTSLALSDIIKLYKRAAGTQQIWNDFFASWKLEEPQGSLSHWRIMSMHVMMSLVV
jgi:hypothetical protein